MRPDGRVLLLRLPAAPAPQGAAPVGGEPGQPGGRAAVRGGPHRRVLPLRLGLHRAERGGGLPVRLRAGRGPGDGGRAHRDLRGAPGVQAPAHGLGAAQSGEQRAAERRRPRGGGRERTQSGGLGEAHAHPVRLAERRVLDHGGVLAELPGGLLRRPAAHPAAELLPGHHAAHHGGRHRGAERQRIPGVQPADHHQYRPDVLRGPPRSGGAQRRHRRLPDGAEDVPHERHLGQSQRLYLLQQEGRGRRRDRRQRGLTTSPGVHPAATRTTSPGVHPAAMSPGVHPAATSPRVHPAATSPRVHPAAKPTLATEGPRDV